MSFEILIDNKLVGVFPMKLLDTSNNVEISTLEGHLLPVLYDNNLPIKIRKKIDSIIIKKLIQFSEKHININMYLDFFTFASIESPNNPKLAARSSRGVFLVILRIENEITI